MEHGGDLLRALAVVLGVAAVASFISQRLRQPVVLGYLLAGLIVGPHLPIPLVADPVVVHTLSELGVVLLMFSLGLEFSLRKLWRVGPSATITAVVQCSLLMWLGFLTGRLFGWSVTTSLFTGATIAISSTTIIAKAFEERKIGGRLRELVVGVLIVEDLIAVLLMAALTTVATGGGVSALSLGRTAVRLGGFLVALVVFGLFVVPRVIRRVTAMGRPELLTVSTIALCFGGALLARELGYSVALGAFLAGSIVAESGAEKQIEHLVEPLRDVFGAVFFVSVGMMMDPGVVVAHWSLVLVLTAVVIAGKIGSVTLGAFLTGNGLKTSIQTGMSLAQIGEFSFIIAGLGQSLGATGALLLPVAVAVSAITTLLTPWLIRAATPVANWVDRVLPRPVQTFVALYGGWIARIRVNDESSAGHDASGGSSKMVRRLFRMLAFDGVAIGAIVLAAAIGGEGAQAFLVAHTDLTPTFARRLVVAVAVVLAIPFCVGVARVSHRLGQALVDSALPAVSVPGAVDLVAAPRRAFLLTLQLALVLFVAVPLVAITQPLLRGFHGAAILVAGVAILAVTVTRTAMNLHGHVRASAQVLVEALARQTGGTVALEVPSPLHAIVDALGDPVSIELTSGAPAIDKSLADLNLRGITGATVLAIARADTAPIVVPSSKERLRAGDVLIVAGTREAAAAARMVLSGGVVVAT